ncbi:unnamed protein product [Lampetra fluviatilis]
MHCRRGTNESPLAYRGALLVLAMAAYPDTTPDVLDPLILARMLELSKEMGISLPVCGHEPLTSQWAARCLDAKDNLRHWAQIAAWTGDLAKDGELFGWAPSRVVHIPDYAGVEDLAAAALRWVLRRRPVGRRDGASTPRGDGDGAAWRAGTTCFKCGQMGHFARHIVSSDGVAMDPDKTSCVHD